MYMYLTQGKPFCPKQHAVTLNVMLTYQIYMGVRMCFRSVLQIVYWSIRYCGLQLLINCLCEHKFVSC